MSSLFDSFMSDTAGTVFRAATGNVDPWTKQILVDQEAQGQIQAGADPNSAQQTAQQDVTTTLKTFTLGGDDRVGADPSQAKISIPGLQSLKDALASFNIPTWVYYAGAGVGVLVVLYVLAPYVGLVKRATD